jgi:hypothetical protein
MTDDQGKEENIGIRGRSDIRSFLTEKFDIEYKWLGYLLAAHGAGMIACLSALKDYKDNPQLKGIGIFVTLFGLGLIFSAVAFSTLSGTVEFMYRYLVYGDEQMNAKHELAMKVYVVSALVSAMIFVIAIGLCVYRFYGF